MSAKDDLRMYKVYHARLQNLRSERNLIVEDEALPGGIDYNADRVQTSPSDQMPARVIRILQRCEEIDQRIERIEDKMQQIRDSINAMNDPDCMRLLWLRYVKDRQWCYIADELHVSENYIKGHMHGIALMQYENSIRNNTK